MLGDIQGFKPQVAQWTAYFKKLQAMLSTAKDVYGDLLGIDLDESSILSIQLRNPLGNARVSYAEIAALPMSAIAEDTIIDKVTITNALKIMVEKGHIRATHAAIAMPGSRVVIKQIKLEKSLSEDDAEVRAWQEARKAFPDLVKNLYLDFAQVKESDQKFLIIVMVKKEDVMPRVECLQQAGLQTKIVDVDYYALERTYHLFSSQLPETHTEKYVAILHFNPHSILLLVMYRKSAMYFNRQTYTGDAMVPLVQRAMGIEVTPVQNMPIMLAPLNLDSSLTFTSPPTPTTNPDELTEEQKSHAVMTIRRLFQSFYADNVGRAIECIAMTGRCALILDLTQYIEKTLGIATIVANPLASLKMSEHVDAKRILKLGPAFALSCGLAMRGVPLWR